MNRINSVPSGICLQELIQSSHAEILVREKNNDRLVHLYSIGAYWVVFERSACLLNGIFPECEITLFRIPGYVEYVVMVSVPHDKVVSYFHKHITQHDEADYKVWAVSPLQMRNYYRWHVQVVKSVL